jgi:Methyltransferase FkbM domain
VVTLDAVCADGRISLIKIDVEGHESAVVRGATATIARDKPSIVFEYAPELLESPEQSPFRWLAEQGYAMFDIRAARHRITGRVRLSLDRVAEQPQRRRAPPAPGSGQANYRRGVRPTLHRGYLAFAAGARPSRGLDGATTAR